MTLPSRSPKGISLVAVIFLAALFVLLGALLVKMAYNYQSSARNYYLAERAFYLAEAGLEDGKVRLARNSAWFTDLPHYPDDDASWLIDKAVGATGKLGGGQFKIVREKGRSNLYSVGQIGRATAVVRFGPEGWREL